MKTLYIKRARQRIIKHVANFCYSNSTRHNLENILRTMPKDVTHTAALKVVRKKNKEKATKYTPGTVSLQVLGSGANGAPRSLYVFTDQSRYMFNCGEGTQRLAHEHKMKLAKLEHIFFTHSSWENIGGLPGISLTVQDVGVPEITIHGPEGIADMFYATKRFIILKDLMVNTADCKDKPYFEDNVMRVTYVPLKEAVPQDSRRLASLDRNQKLGEAKKSDKVEDESSASNSDELMTSDDETDYYAHERVGNLKDVNTGKDIKRRRVECVSKVAMSYICKLHARPGALCLEACVEKNVPPGPLLGRLKAGKDVTLEDGRIVKSSDVTLPEDPGPVFIVIECPDMKFLDPLVENEQFVKHQTNSSSPNELAYIVVHFTPPHIVNTERYQNWMNRFSSSTKHLMINDQNTCMGSTAVHRIQYKLNTLHPTIFPLLGDCGIPIGDPATNCSTESIPLSVDKKLSNLEIYQGRTFSIVQLRPNKSFDRSSELMLNLEDYKKEVFHHDEEMANALSELQANLKGIPSGGDEGYPYIVFLGTGSCIPNKTRNTSGILLRVGPEKCVLLDCGEGTYGQLVRFYGSGQISEVMSTLHVIFVSHLHADHHIGLIGLLKARRKYTVNTKNANKPLYLIAPKQIMTWLNYYNHHFEPILQQVELIPSDSIVFRSYQLRNDMKYNLCSSIDMRYIFTAPVTHCPNSFGITFKHISGWKVTYSGDTMPCDSLVELGKDSTVLIHEATMEDELVNEARKKMHSTTSEAIDIGKRMNAKFTLLTHFSQRYATLPRFNENFKEGIGIAFDNMKIRLDELNILPLLYPALKLMFSSHQEELEQKAYRRHLKQLKNAESQSSSGSTSSSPSLSTR